MTSLFLSKEMAMSLRAIFDLAFAVSLLTLRWIMVLIRQRACKPQSHASKRQTAWRWAVWVNAGRLAAIDAENVT